MARKFKPKDVVRLTNLSEDYPLLAQSNYVLFHHRRVKFTGNIGTILSKRLSHHSGWYTMRVISNSFKYDFPVHENELELYVVPEIERENALTLWLDSK